MASDKSFLIEGLEAEKDELLEKLSHIDSAILYLKQTSFTPVNGHHLNGKNPAEDKAQQSVAGKYRGYKSAKTTKDKVKIIFRDEKRFLMMKQIRDIARSIEPNFDSDKIQSSVYTLKGDGVLINKSVGKGNQNVFWGSKNWLDENGEIKPEFMYDESVLQESKEDEIEI